MQEFTELKEVAGDSATGIGKPIRANLIPPLCRELPDYDRARFWTDLLAGVTVAVITIPQSMMVLPLRPRSRACQTTLGLARR